MKRIYRDTFDGFIGGVCAGLGNYFKIDPSIFRILFILAVIFGYGYPALIYIVLWIVLPEK